MGNTIEECTQPEPDDICEQLRKKIDELINRNKRELGGGGTHGLRHRFEEQIHGKGGPGTTAWDNHEQEIKNQQKALRKKLREFDENSCGDPPSGAWNWATRPVPQPKQWVNPNMETLKTVGTGVAAGALLYGAYRVIRMLPSLLPPLWPTIPANVAVP